MSPVLVRPFDSAEKTDLLSFYRANFGSGDRVARLFEWRGSTAASGGNRPYGAWLDGQLLGTVNVVGWTLGGRGDRREICWQQDSIVSEAARGKGVGKALVNGAGTDWSIIMAKGTTAAMYALRKSAGFVDAPNPTYLTRVLRAFGTGGGWKRRAAAPLLTIRNWFHRLPPTSRPLSVRPLEDFGGSYDSLAERLVAADWIGPVKSAAFLRWRYLDCPIRSYRISEVVENGLPLGALVLRVPTASGGVAWLVDLIGDLEDRDAATTLLAEAFRTAKASGASMIRTFATSRRARALLLAAGFIDTADTPHFTFRTQPSADINLADVDWNFWHGDGDAELYQ